MRSLVIGFDHPWPVTSGSMLRLANVIEALGSCSEVDLFSTVEERRQTPPQPHTGGAVRRWRTATYHTGELGAARRAAWLLSRRPLEVLDDADRRVAADLLNWAQPPYDIVWVSKAPTWIRVGRPRLGPTVVDLDDLEDRKARVRLSLPDLGGGYPPTVAGRVHRHLAGGQIRLNARRWSALQGQIAAEAEAVVVCSELDAGRLGVANVEVVPNGYDAPPDPAGPPPDDAPPVVMFQGVLSYGPNADAAAWLVQEIAPRLRRTVPGATIRLVGAAPPAILGLRENPGVTVTGEVPDMRPELAGACLVAVPIRYGSGTRIKALEAFAHRLPVVSTPLGVEGLDVTDGEHVLIAEGPGEFAAACARLLSSPRLRRDLTDRAAELVRQRYGWSSGRSAVTALARRVTAGPRATVHS